MVNQKHGEYKLLIFTRFLINVDFKVDENGEVTDFKEPVIQT